jgi:hypothetical protein
MCAASKAGSVRSHTSSDARDQRKDLRAKT